MGRMKVRIIPAVFVLNLAVSGFAQQQPGNAATDDLLRQFVSERVFWKQLEIAKKLVANQDRSVLSVLEVLLNDDDRHLRGNVAFVFAGLGDERGFPAITAMLKDRSDRPEGQGEMSISSDGRYHVAEQIRADRYYAVHLLGELKDRRAVPILIPLLTDSQLNYKVPWALGKIGDRAADEALIARLTDYDPSIRVYVIQALVELGAKEALPNLRTLLNDNEKSRLGEPVTVAQAASAAIVKLEKLP
jgi:HEAT repeat protein